METEKKMSFQALEQTKTRVSTNPDIHEKDKEQIEDFLRKKKASVQKSTLSHIASRIQVVAEYLDKPLHKVEKRNLENYVGDLNQGNVKKKNGEPYSEPSKDKHYKVLQEFVRDQLDKGELLEDLENPASIDRSFDPRERPYPTQVKKVAEQANNNRDKAFAVFGWATGARIGELVYTDESHQYPEGIKWRDIRFKEREMVVTLKGKTGERTIPVRTGMPLMKQLQEETMNKLDDPVFKQRQNTNFCPKCKTELKVIGDSNYTDRKYGCKSEECSWKGLQEDAIKEKKPWDDESAREALKRMKKSSKIPERITHKPHWFFWDARALYWAAKDKNENFLRGFFGWSKNSDSPSYYIELMNESVLAGIREDFGESLSEDEKRFNDDELKPLKCDICGSWISTFTTYCNSCGNEVDESLRDHNRPEDSKINRMREEAEEMGYEEDQFREIVRGVLETMESQ